MPDCLLVDAKALEGEGHEQVQDMKKKDDDVNLVVLLSSCGDVCD